MRRLNFIALFSALLLLLSACKSGPDTTQMDPPGIPVAVTTPSILNIPIYVESVGILHPSVHAELRPSVSGKISEILVEEGQWVEKGTPLFKLGSSSYQIKLDELQAQMATNRATLTGLQKKFERYKGLADKSLIAQAEWDDLETQIAKALAAIDADNAKHKIVAGDLQKCTVTSPLAGRIGKLDVHYGLPVSPSQARPLATISQMDPLLLEFNVTEKEFLQISQEHNQVEVKALCAQCQTVKGTITFFDNQFDEKTGLLLVRAKIENPSLYLRPGQSVHVNVPVSTLVNTLLIPQKAVKYSPQGPYVFVVQDDSTVTIRPLVVGKAVGNQLIVTEGLTPSERIITEGHLRLYPGAKVVEQL